MDFIEYCHSKRIDASRFLALEHARFSEWEHIFNQSGATSFTQQKLFLINDVRRRYTYIPPILEKNEKESDLKTALVPSAAPKPAGFKPKFK